MLLISIVYYKLKMMLRDKIFFGAMIVIPVFITLATGFALRHEKMGMIPVAIVDEDMTHESSLIIKRMAEKTGINLELTNRSSAADRIRQNKVEAVFVIKKGFAEKIREGNNTGLIDFIKSPSSFSSDYVSELLAGEVMRIYSNYAAAGSVVSRYEQMGMEAGEELFYEALEFADSFWEPEPLMKMEYFEMTGESYDSIPFYMPAATATSTGIIMVFIMLYILFCSGWLVEERTNGTLKRLATGMNALYITYLGNIVAMFISGMVQIFLFAFLIKCLFEVVLFTHFFSYLVMAAYLLSVISMSMLLSSLLKTPAQLQAAAPAFALITGFIGGCFWNFVNVPEKIKMLSKLTPQGWALSAVNDLIIKPDVSAGTINAFLVMLIIPLILLPLSYIIIRAEIRLGKIST